MERDLSEKSGQNYKKAGAAVRARRNKDKLRTHSKGILNTSNTSFPKLFGNEVF